MDETRPAYYAIIPADVRYDDQIPPNAKLLYGEISALIGADGYCYATNEYFRSIYNFSDATITRLISELVKHGYIVRECVKDKTGQIVKRKLYLKVSVPEIQPPLNFEGTPPQYLGEGTLKNEGETNTSIYKKENKKEKPKRKKADPPSEDFDPLPLFVSWIQDHFGDSADKDARNALYLALVRFRDGRREIKKPIKSKAAVTALCNRLLRYGGNIPAMIDLLDTATSSGWQTVYPPKAAQAAAPSAKPRRDEEWL